MWAMVLATIGESKVKFLIKVLEILESKDWSKVNKTEGKNRKMDLVIRPWGPRVEGIVKNILELSCIVVIWSQWTYKACIRIRRRERKNGGYEEKLCIYGCHRVRVEECRVRKFLSF